MTGPLVDACVDLRDFAYMPLDVLRLRDSDLSAEATDGEFRAAVMLWCAAWHQVPAASLPDNDKVLASLAGLGRDVEAWGLVKDGALRKWVRCDDGRLYHPIVAEKANEAWEQKKKQRLRTEAARAAKLAHSDNASAPAVTVVVTESVTETATQTVTGSKGTERNGTTEACASVESAPAPKPKRARPRVPIPSDAQPTEVDRKAAAEAGLPPEMFRAEWRKFRDHHLAKGTLMADWAAAWRTWLGNIAQFQPKTVGNSNGKPSVQDAARSNIERGVDFGPPPPRYMPVGRSDSAGGDSTRLLPQGGRGGAGDLRSIGSGSLIVLPAGSGLSGDGPEDGDSWQKPMAADSG